MNAVTQSGPRNSLIVRMANKYGVDPEKMLATLKATAFKGDVTNEQMMALCIVAENYGLNPWTREIYAFPDRGGIVPVVGVDGWSRIINEHPQYDGLELIDTPNDGSGPPVSCKCIMHRKDRSHPTVITEYFAEVKRDTAPWKSHPRRLLRHKALIQCARIAFGFVGIFDQDEAERIVAATPPFTGNPRDGLEGANPETVNQYVSRVTDILELDALPGEDERVGAQADALFTLHQQLNGDDALYTAVLDACAARGVMKKSAFRETVALGSKRYQERNLT